MNLNGSRPDTVVETPVAANEISTFADLFCGIGGFHVAAANLGMKCVFACDIDPVAREVYELNFNMRPGADIAALDLGMVPTADVLFAGLPCQSFSIIGNRQAFGDHRGTLFLELARVVAAKRPKAIVIENVRQLVTIDKGEAFRCIIILLEALGYSVTHKILNALDFGLPQKRERVFIVALDVPVDSFQWPEGGVEMNPLSAILEDQPHPRHYVSPRIRRARKQAHTAKETPAIWHENKGGNVSSHPFSCALRAGASHNYLLVDGERRLTPRELFRLQGFPEDYVLPETDAAARRLTGNAVPVPLAQAVIKQVQSVYEKATIAG
ncbi:MAG: DNA cytosine methyltransferase [Anaerolineaceae bacterium]|nr:DNA cytosine methyltransferase [Anaerolineaceae bacterium]MDE0327476.1 DNA cytosine methyltransferase [Anaerolineaceae bacterium]